VWSSLLSDGVVIIDYVRPPDNVLGFADLAELETELRGWAADERARVVVITGGIEGYFVAHADLADVADLVADRPPRRYGPEQWGRPLALLAAIPQPVVAAVNGQAWGGGCELALAAQLRVASESAHFRFVEVADGAIPGAGGTQRLPRLIGPSRAARLVLGGQRVDAAEACAIGLVDAVLPAPDFRQRLREWVAPMAAQPRHSLAAAKRALLDGLELPLQSGLELEQEIFRTVLRSPQTHRLHERRLAPDELSGEL
jgi:enoyl-CoA hydratase/carnithine racemase